MCGICGVIGSDIDSGVAETAVRSMLRAIHHRGPDGSGIAPIRAAGFSGFVGHTRLSILDLSSVASQPMVWRDNILSFNGEIYNFRDIASNIVTNQGIRISSTGDSEVLLKLISLKGEAALPELRGMFAFALFKNDEQSLILARDEFGIKPLYYYHDIGSGRLVFGSEVRCLLASGLVPRRVSVRGLRSLLSYGSVVPPHTIVHEVRAVPPGTSVKIGSLRKALVFRKYREPNEDWLNSKPESDGRRAEELFLANLEDSVKYHLISDARLGCFLSGGIDSTTLALLGSRAVVPEQLETVCAAAGHGTFDESFLAERTAETLGTLHTTIPVDSEKLSNELEEVFAAADQPSFDGANVYFVSRESSRLGLKVMLSGLGGDEALGGYDFCRESAWKTGVENLFNSLPNLPQSLRRRASTPTNYRTDRLRERLTENAGVMRWLTRTQWIPSNMRAALLREPGWEQDSEPLFPEELRASLSEQDWNEDRLNTQLKALTATRMSMTFLADTDAMSMANSQEVRVPFVDQQVFRSAFRIPSNLKTRTPGKEPLRRLLRRSDLAFIADYPVKHGFHLPFEKWLRGPSPLVAQIAQHELAESGAFSPAAAELIRQYRFGSTQVPWTVPYILLVASDYICRHALRV